MKTVILGTRDSALALTQARLVSEWLQQQWPELTVCLKTFKTQGDRLLEQPLAAFGADKGLFVKELESALLSHEIDLAVHSLKDMLAEQPQGLAMQSVGPREDPRDVWIQPEGLGLMDLPAGKTVGTSSVRRVAQLRQRRPDLHYVTLRGNLQTRFQKLEASKASASLPEERPENSPNNYSIDAMVLAAAGLHRLGWQHKITAYLEPAEGHLPAVGQGVLAAEYRQDDEAIRALLRPLTHADVEAAITAERAVLQALGAGCQTPLGVHAFKSTEAAGMFTLSACLYASAGLTPAISVCEFFSAQTARDVGLGVGQALLA